MYMTDSEIVDRYTRLGTSARTIAELNACSASQISEILTRNGIQLRRAYNRKKTEAPDKSKYTLTNPEPEKEETMAKTIPAFVVDILNRELDSYDDKLKHIEAEIALLKASADELINKQSELKEYINGNS